jgi:glycine/D-amino acid oxidase-like deaminating enzyme
LRPVSQTPDGLPILDHLPDLEGVYCATAPGDESFLLAPLTSQVMTQWLIDNTAADVELKPLRLARFAETEATTTEETFGKPHGVIPTE